jgi:hypothetical protein
MTTTLTSRAELARRCRQSKLTHDAALDLLYSMPRNEHEWGKLMGGANDLVRQRYKQRVRKQRFTIEPEQNYAPGQVAAILNVSYDAALRFMSRMTGVIDLGTPTRRYKRGKKKLRISGKNLLTFIRSKTRD